MDMGGDPCSIPWQSIFVSASTDAASQDMILLQQTPVDGSRWIPDYVSATLNDIIKATDESGSCRGDVREKKGVRDAPEFWSTNSEPL